jgi:hypothetical protein
MPTFKNLTDEELAEFLALVKNSDSVELNLTVHETARAKTYSKAQLPWSSPLVPHLGWVMLGWLMTWAAVELGMFQRLLDTTSLSGGEWGVVLALSLLTPAVVFADKIIRVRRRPSAVPEMDLREPAAATSVGDCLSRVMADGGRGREPRPG